MPAVSRQTDSKEEKSKSAYLALRECCGIKRRASLAHGAGLSHPFCEKAWPISGCFALTADLRDDSRQEKSKTAYLAFVPNGRRLDTSSVEVRGTPVSVGDACLSSSFLNREPDCIGDVDACLVVCPKWRIV